MSGNRVSTGSRGLSENMKKVAVTMPGQQALFLELDQVVLENCGRAQDQDCPFVQAGIKLTSILCELLQIGEPPNEDEMSFYPMFFTTDKPLEEFFSTCINLIIRTWKEMRASKEDFEKVLSVVKEQITRALDKNQMPKTFEAFKQKLVVLAYPELRKIWDAERQKREESKAQAKPILWVTL